MTPIIAASYTGLLAPYGLAVRMRDDEQMRTGGIDWLTAGATAAAACAAAWAAWQAGRSAKQSAVLVKIEADRWEAERASRLRADVIPLFDWHGPELRLVVRNRGPAEARDVDLQDDTSETDDLVYEIDTVFPVPRMPPVPSGTCRSGRFQEAA